MEVKIYKELEQGSEEWHEVRCGKMTASHANTIRANGKGLEKYAYQKALDIFSTEREERFENSHTRRGNETEPVAAQAYCDLTGNTVYEVGFVEVNDYVGTSPDRVINEENGLVEIKCPAREGYGQALEGAPIKNEYKDQMEAQMWSMDRDFVDFVQYNSSFPLPIIVRRYYSEPDRRASLLAGLERGEKLIKEHLKQLKKGVEVLNNNYATKYGGNYV